MKKSLVAARTSILAMIFSVSPQFSCTANPPVPGPELMERLRDELVARHGVGEKGRIERGLRQAASLWRSEDGDAAAFTGFARGNFISDRKVLDATFDRFEKALESMDGHFNEITRDLRWWSELDLGHPPIDRILAAYDAWAHFTEDFFSNQAAFMVLLNFPLTTLQERDKEGRGWTRRQWAEARLANRFSKRIPAAVNQAIARAGAEGDAYIAEYNIWMHHVLAEDGARLFPRAFASSPTGTCGTSSRPGTPTPTGCHGKS